jgi:hypothetical protein
MKNKILLLISIGLLSSSCRREDSTTNNLTNQTSNPSVINPPSWIKGTWRQGSDKSYTEYIFTNNNITVQSSIGISTSVKPAADVGGYSQTSTDTEFTYTLGTPISSTTYKFRKIDATKIEMALGANYGHNQILTKQ